MSEFGGKITLRLVEDVGSLLNIPSTFLPNSESWGLNAQYNVQHVDDQALGVGLDFKSTNGQSINEEVAHEHIKAIDAFSVGGHWDLTTFSKPHKRWGWNKVKFGDYSSAGSGVGWQWAAIRAKTKELEDVNQDLDGPYFESRIAKGYAVHLGRDGEHSISFGLEFTTRNAIYLQELEDMEDVSIASSNAEAGLFIAYNLTPFVDENTSTLYSTLGEHFVILGNIVAGFGSAYAQHTQLTQHTEAATEAFAFTGASTDPFADKALTDSSLLFVANNFVGPLLGGADIDAHSTLRNDTEGNWLRAGYYSMQLGFGAAECALGGSGAVTRCLDRVDRVLIYGMNDVIKPSPLGRFGIGGALATAKFVAGAALGLKNETDEVDEENGVEKENVMQGALIASGFNMAVSLFANPDLTSANELEDGEARMSFQYFPWSHYNDGHRDTRSRGGVILHKYFDPADIDGWPLELTLGFEAKQFSYDSLWARIADEAQPETDTPITTSVGIGLSPAWQLAEDFYVRLGGGAQVALQFQGIEASAGGGLYGQLGFEHQVGETRRWGLGVRGAYTAIFNNGAEYSVAPYFDFSWSD